MTDIIRQMAEEYIGQAILDENWTPFIRDRWKQFFHGTLYGTQRRASQDCAEGATPAHMGETLPKGTHSNRKI